MGTQGTALITGASSGIGVEFARGLAARGFDCVLTARRVDRLEALAAELRDKHGVTAHVVPSDLGTAGGAAALIAGVAALGAPITFLVNNAGLGMYGRFVDTDIDRVVGMLQLNVTSLTVLTHHYAREMVARGGGRILQVASVGAFQPSPLYAAYSATKVYVRDFSDAIAFELRGTGVTVTTVCPGLTESEFHAVAEHVKPRQFDLVTMTAHDVAERALTGAMKGRVGVTPGFVNKLNEWAMRLLPRRVATWLAGRSMQTSA